MQTFSFSREDAYLEMLRRARNIAFDIATLWAETLGQEDALASEEFLCSLNEEVMGTLDEALGDAEKAWNEGQEVVAGITFETSMQLAGIKAAKSVMPGFFA